MCAALGRHQTSTGSTPHVCWVAGLAVHTADGENKPSPTQCLLNVRPASPVLASIHSARVSTSCWRYRHAGGTSTMLWTKAGLMLARCLWRWPTFSVAPNTTRWPNTGLLLAQCRRQWTNISPALGQRLVFDRLQDRKRWTGLRHIIHTLIFPGACTYDGHDVGRSWSDLNLITTRTRRHVK